MKILGVTGGIGSGKSTVCRFFETLGIPVFTADDVAKSLYTTDPSLKQAVIQHFGEDTYTNGELNRQALARVVFGDPSALETLNKLVHPRVGAAFSAWMQDQDAPYVIREAAILIESGSHIDCDAILLITAPEEMRIQRVVQRDGASEEDVRSRMQRQWSDDKRRPYARFELVNDGNTLLIPQLEEVDRQLRV